MIELSGSTKTPKNFSVIVEMVVKCKNILLFGL